MSSNICQPLISSMVCLSSAKSCLRHVPRKWRLQPHLAPYSAVPRHCPQSRLCSCPAPQIQAYPEPWPLPLAAWPTPIPDPQLRSFFCCFLTFCWLWRQMSAFAAGLLISHCLWLDLLVSPWTESSGRPNPRWTTTVKFPFWEDSNTVIHPLIKYRQNMYLIVKIS